MRLKLTLSFLSMNCLATTAASCSTALPGLVYAWKDVEEMLSKSISLLGPSNVIYQMVLGRQT